MTSVKSTGKILSFGPLALLYFLSISELDTNFENYFEILSFNIQLIIIYYWTLKRSDIFGSGHVFFAGIINDVVMGIPLGLSSLSYLFVALISNYIKNITVNTSITTDWFTFLIAISLSNLLFFILVISFSNLPIRFVEISYNVEEYPTMVETIMNLDLIPGIYSILLLDPK